MSVLFKLIKLPVGSKVINSTVTKLGTEIAEYVTTAGKTFKQVAYSPLNKGAKKLALQGYKQEVGQAKRTYGFVAPDKVDDWGLPLTTAWSTTPQKARPLFFRLGLIQEAGGTRAQTVEYASKLADYWKM
jgi:hypothetical protein